MAALILRQIKSFSTLWDMLVCITYVLWPNQLKPWEVPAVIGSIVVVDVLTCCALLHFVCDLKAIDMNRGSNLIQELVLYEFEQDHCMTKASKNVCCVKSEGPVDHCTITRLFKEFSLSCKNIDNHAMSVRPKTVCSEAMLQAIETNLVSSTERVSGEILRIYYGSSAS